MPKFDANITVIVTRIYSASVTAQDESAAGAKIQAAIDKVDGDYNRFPWDCDDESVEIDVEVDA